jgi:hypothetical protein
MISATWQRCRSQRQRDSSFKKPVLSVHSIDNLVIKEDFEAKTEIFLAENAGLTILAKDALAERVLKAGCTGLEFCHINTPDFDVDCSVTIRTKRGISLRKR